MQRLVRENPLCHAVAAGQNEIVISQRKFLNHRREQGQTVTIVLFHPGQMVEPRGTDFHGTDGSGDSLRRIEKSVEVGVGKEFAKNLKAFLAPSHAGQPIMNYSNPHMDNNWIGWKGAGWESSESVFELLMVISSP